MIGMTLFTGTVVGLQGYAALNQIGAAAFTGFVSAYFNTREIAPLVAGLALSATVGAGFTAQLGSMRINEEIDALEGMGVPSLPYLVTTRIIAGADRRASRCTRSGWSAPTSAPALVTVLLRRPVGRHLRPLLRPVPVPGRRALVVPQGADLQRGRDHECTATTATGPAAGQPGSGVAVGRAVRTAIVMINIIDFFMSLAIWGATTTVRVAG